MVFVFYIVDVYVILCVLDLDSVECVYLGLMFDFEYVNVLVCCVVGLLCVVDVVYGYVLLMILVGLCL